MNIKQIISDGNTYCFFLGAGASINSGMPGVNDLAKYWFKKYHIGNGYIDNSVYDQYIELYIEFIKINRILKNDDHDNFYNDMSLHQILSNAEPSLGYYDLADIMANTRHKIAMTTNYDKLLIKTINNVYERNPIVINQLTGTDRLNGICFDPTVIELHLDPLSILNEDLKLGLQLHLMSAEIQRKMNELFVDGNYMPIFIGYSGSDSGVMDCLMSDRVIESFLKSPYGGPIWAFYKNETPNQFVRDFIRKSKGQFVRYDNFDYLCRELSEVFIK